MDFSCLSVLKELYLNENPIVSLPSCVRSLPRLETLSMGNCNMLTSVENPPHTLTHLNLFHTSSKPMLQKVVFDPEMSPLQLLMGWDVLPLSPFEVEGMIKIQPMADIEENVLRSLGWTKPDLLNERRVVTRTLLRKEEKTEIQMYYEFGIFSTIYGGQEMPNWIMDRSTGPPISFTIPSSPNRFRGLNFCCVLTSPFLLDEGIGDPFIYLPVIIISNITKNHTWIYHHYLERVFLHRNFLMFLSHWMFEMNEMECGDHVTITLKEYPYDTSNAVTKDCGVSFVYDNGSKDEEDVLSYYKSWNHIIGGDLTGFQTTTGKYILSIWRILMYSFLGNYYLCREGDHFKVDEQSQFRALSQRKSSKVEDGP